MYKPNRNLRHIKHQVINLRNNGLTFHTFVVFWL